MSRYVVDASVAVKWFLPEIHDDAALRLLNGGHTILVSDLIFSEVGNILWKRIRMKNITAEEGHKILSTFVTLPLVVSPSSPLILLALEVANQTGRTVYDSLYLALAVRESAVMVTADEKFVNALATTPLSSAVLWVEDIP